MIYSLRFRHASMGSRLEKLLRFPSITSLRSHTPFAFCRSPSVGSFGLGQYRRASVLLVCIKKSPFGYRKDKPAERSTKAGAARLRASCFYIVPAVLQHCGDFFVLLIYTLILTTLYFYSRGMKKNITTKKGMSKSKMIVMASLVLRELSAVSSSLLKNM